MIRCNRCGDRGRKGSDGYWVYCDCQEGEKRRIKDKMFEPIKEEVLGV